MYEPADDYVATAALKAAGMLPWAAEASVELLAFYRDKYERLEYMYIRCTCCT